MKVEINHTVLHRWIANLRSGEYAQTTGELKNDDGYCCLGVLCETVGAKFEPHTYDYDNWCGSTEKRTTVRPVLNGLSIAKGDGDDCLSEEFRRQINMSEELENTLIELNDENRFSFAEIADQLESGNVELPEDEVIEDEFLVG